MIEDMSDTTMFIRIHLICIKKKYYITFHSASMPFYILLYTTMKRGKKSAPYFFRLCYSFPFFPFSRSHLLTNSPFRTWKSIKKRMKMLMMTTMWWCCSATTLKFSFTLNYKAEKNVFSSFFDGEIEIAKKTPFWQVSKALTRERTNGR